VNGRRDVFALLSDPDDALALSCSHCGCLHRVRPQSWDKERGMYVPDWRVRMWECGDCGRYWHRNMRALNAALP